MKQISDFANILSPNELYETDFVSVVIPDFDLLFPLRFSESFSENVKQWKNNIKNINSETLILVSFIWIDIINHVMTVLSSWIDFSIFRQLSNLQCQYIHVNQYYCYLLLRFLFYFWLSSNITKNMKWLVLSQQWLALM